MPRTLYRSQFANAMRHGNVFHVIFVNCLLFNSVCTYTVHSIFFAKYFVNYTALKTIIRLLYCNANHMLFLQVAYTRTYHSLSQAGSHTVVRQKRYLKMLVIFIHNYLCPAILWGRTKNLLVVEVGQQKHAVTKSASNTGSVHYFDMAFRWCSAVWRQHVCWLQMTMRPAYDCPLSGQWWFSTPMHHLAFALILCYYAVDYSMLVIWTRSHCPKIEKKTYW